MLCYGMQWDDVLGFVHNLKGMLIFFRFGCVGIPFININSALLETRTLFNSVSTSLGQTVCACACVCAVCASTSSIPYRLDCALPLRQT